MNFLKFIKDTLFPKKCYSCKKEWSFLCEECFLSMQKYTSCCYFCKNYSDNFSTHHECSKEFFLDSIFVLTHYNNKVIKKLIKDSKFFWRKDILEDFAFYITKSEEFKNIYVEDSIIIPVPMYFFRKLKRWYNQSYILAKFISNFMWRKCEDNIIKRIKNTRQQSHLSRQDRLHNLDNSFRINKNYIDNIIWKTVYIVDDVVSTWTTLNEIAKLLKYNWALKVIWICIASD